MDPHDQPWSHRTKCPACGVLYDRVSSASLGDNPPPTPGDFAVCFNCGAANVFDETNALRRPTPKDWSGLSEGQVRTIRHAQMALFRRKKKARG